jgi:hypothetical protein
MNKALQKRSLSAAGLALALALGLAAVSHSAQAATVQITLNRIFAAASFPAGTFSVDATGQSTESDLRLLVVRVAPQISLVGTNFYYIAHSAPTTRIDTYDQFTFKDPRINNGALTTGYALGYGETSSTPSVTLRKVVFDTASTAAPSFTVGHSYPEWVPASTAVPEPSTFIPAALLVMGALLRRRRPRSHRSGRATA